MRPSIQFLDSIRDVMAEATKVCQDRDNLRAGERSADARIEELEAKVKRLREALVEIQDNPYKGECECGVYATEALEAARAAEKGEG